MELVGGSAANEPRPVDRLSPERRKALYDHLQGSRSDAQSSSDVLTPKGSSRRKFLIGGVALAGLIAGTAVGVSQRGEAAKPHEGPETALARSRLRSVSKIVESNVNGQYYKGDEFDALIQGDPSQIKSFVDSHLGGGVAKLHRDYNEWKLAIGDGVKTNLGVHASYHHQTKELSAYMLIPDLSNLMAENTTLSPEAVALKFFGIPEQKVNWYPADREFFTDEKLTGKEAIIKTPTGEEVIIRVSPTGVAEFMSDKLLKRSTLASK